MDMPLIRPLDIDPHTATDAERLAAQLTELAIECEQRARHSTSAPAWMREFVTAMNAAGDIPQDPLDGAPGGAGLTYERGYDRLEGAIAAAKDALRDADWSTAVDYGVDALITLYKRQGGVLTRDQVAVVVELVKKVGP